MEQAKLTQRDAILSVLYVLGNYENSKGELIDLESLTVGCFRLFKTKFSMEKFPEYPRIDRVYKRMSELVKGRFVKEFGDSTYGLTVKGVKFVQVHRNLLESIKARSPGIEQNISDIKNQDLSSDEIQREISKLKRTSASEKFSYSKKKEITLQDYLDYLKLDIYAQPTSFMRRHKKIQKISEKDPCLNELFEFMKSCFGESYKEIRKNAQSLMGG